MSESTPLPENIGEILQKLRAITAELSRESGEASVDEAAVKQRLVHESGGAITLSMLSETHPVTFTVDDMRVEGRMFLGNALKFSGTIHVPSWAGSSNGWLVQLDSGSVVLNASRSTAPFPPLGEQFRIEFRPVPGAQLIAMFEGSPINDVGDVYQGIGFGNLLA